MNENDIIEIVEKLIDDELYATSDDHFCGADIEGKEEFFKRLKVELEKFFDDNDLSK